MSLCNTLRHPLNIDVSSARETSALENIKIVRYIVPTSVSAMIKTSLHDTSTVRPRLCGLMQRKCAN